MRQLDNYRKLLWELNGGFLGIYVVPFLKWTAIATIFWVMYKVII